MSASDVRGVSKEELLCLLRDGFVMSPEELEVDPLDPHTIPGRSPIFRPEPHTPPASEIARLPAYQQRLKEALAAHGRRETAWELTDWETILRQISDEDWKEIWRHHPAESLVARTYRTWEAGRPPEALAAAAKKLDDTDLAFDGTIAILLGWLMKTGQVFIGKEPLLSQDGKDVLSYKLYDVWDGHEPSAMPEGWVVVSGLMLHTDPEASLALFKCMNHSYWAALMEC
jgi:hypothetical protein